MGSTHTPGPWSSQTVTTVDRGGSSERKRVVDDQGVIIYEAPLTPETEANARLIAAAPELLEALKDLSSSLDQMELPVPTHMWKENYAIVRDAAKAAIAKVGK